MGFLSRHRYCPPQERTSWWVTGGLLLASVALVYPFVWMLLSAGKSNMEIFRPLQLWPEEWSLEYWRQLWRGDWFPFRRVFMNSMVAALGQAAGAVAVTSLAGYAFAGRGFKGRSFLFLLAVSVIVIPTQALAIPLFLWVNRLGLMDHWLGVVMPGMVSGLGVVYFTQVFRQIPQTLWEAARMEGASEWRVYTYLLPLARSALLSFGLIHFILCWHQHLIPLLILSSPENQTMPLALASLYGSSLRFPYAVLMAGSVLSVLPPALLFLSLQRRCRNALADLLIH